MTGQITAVRFWKASSENGTHTGNIWSSTGTLLASVTFTNETASGWQQQALTTPLAIAANTTYVVSVNTGNTYYVATNGGLSSQVINEDLSSVVGNNGVYAQLRDSSRQTVSRIRITSGTSFCSESGPQLVIGDAESHQCDRRKFLNWDGDLEWPSALWRHGGSSLGHESACPTAYHPVR